jgi:hypothetical protein
LDGRAIPIIGFEALLKNKIAAGRDQDRADVKALLKVRDSDGSLAGAYR